MKKSLAALTVALLVASPEWLAAAEVADAVMRGDSSALMRLLQQGADVNASQPDGATALHWAAYRDDTDAVRGLLEAGADVNAANRAGVTPLLMATVSGNVEMIRLLLESGADANEAFTNGETALMMAARTGRAAAIEVLVEHGAEVDARESLRGTTALMWAAAYSNPEAVKALLEAGADHSAQSAVTARGRSPYLAPSARSRIEEYERGVGQAGRSIPVSFDDDAGFNDADLADEESALRADERRAEAGGDAVSADVAAIDGEIEAALIGAVATLAEAAAVIERVGASDGMATADDAEASVPPLAARMEALAASIESLAANVSALADRIDSAATVAVPAVTEPEAIAAVDIDAVEDDDGEGFSVGRRQQAVDAGGLRPLIFAAREGDLESVKLLLEAGADVNQTSEFGWTALLTATQNRYYELGRYLLEQGADPNLSNKSGWNPLYIATDNRNIEGGDYPTREPDMDHFEYIELLLEHGADPNQRLAMDCGRPGCASTETRTIFTHQWLYEEGATPFLRAAQSGDLKLLELLLEHGADPTIPTADGVTALMVASGIGWVEGVTYEWSPEETLEVVELLLSLGADVNARETLDGRTALMGAAHKGRNEVVELLVEHGADLSVRDIGSRDSIHALAGVTWQAIDYADGLVRVGVQSAIPHAETAALLRRLMEERGLEVPEEGRTLDSICITDVCRPDYQP